MALFIIIFISCISLYIFYKLVKLYTSEKNSLKRTVQTRKLLFTGFVANIFDTLGVGSFAVIVALNNRWKIINEKLVPGTLNSQGILASMMQAILFIQIVKVDLYLLSSFVIMACSGAFLSSYIVSKMNKQTLRLVMFIGFFFIALLILSRQLNLLPIGGEAISATQFHYLVGLPAMLIIGMVPAIGMGMYVPIQVLMFLLGFSPLVAFPIMTTAGSLAQATTAFVFIKNKQIATKESLIMGLAGVAGVLCIIQFIPYFNPQVLRWLLFVIVTYNTMSIWNLYKEEKGKRILKKSPT